MELQAQTTRETQKARVFLRREWDIEKEATRVEPNALGSNTRRGPGCLTDGRPSQDGSTCNRV